MGNLCCISSKPQKKYSYKPGVDPSPTSSSDAKTHLRSQKKGGRSPNNRSAKFRQSEIDYYYDDYEELAQADSSTNQLTKKAKKSQNRQQPVSF